MPEPATLLVFAVAAIALIAVPGPNLLYIGARSMSEGRRAGLVSVLGVETGTLLHGCCLVQAALSEAAPSCASP